jgi:hypothetical protein
MGDDYENGGERRAPGRDARDVLFWRLRTVEADVEALERRADSLVTHAQLAETFKARDAILAREFVPRSEQQQSRDWKLRLWLGTISVAGLLIAAGELLIAVKH